LDQLRRKVAEAISIAFGIADIDENVLPLHIAETAERLKELIGFAASERRSGSQDTDTRNFLRMNR
jgi:hypothetical protein